eukprot:jgi/Phyca11/69349/gw1.5.384.1
MLIAALALVLSTTLGEQHSERFENGTTTSWPSLRFHFMIKRQSMEVHGHSDFSVLANPVVSSSSVIYDTFTTFSDDYNYTVIDGRGYASNGLEVECDDSDTIPSINSIVQALNEAVPVSSVSSSTGVIACPSGETFKVTVNGIDLGVCFSGPSGFTLYGSDLEVDVEYLKSSEGISKPIFDGIECEKVASPTVVSAIGRSLLTGEPL